MQIVFEAGCMLQTAACTAHCGTGSRCHRQHAGAFTSRRPRLADVVIGQRSYRHIVAAKSPLNEGSSDADVLAARAAGENPPGVLDELAGAVKGAAASAAREIVGGADPGAAANLMPGGGDVGSGNGASLDKSPAAQAASSAVNGADGAAGSSSRDVDGDAQDGGNDAIVGSQEWLAPQRKLPDQTPPEADNDGVIGAEDLAPAAPAQSDQQQQQQSQQSGQLAQPQQQRPSEEQLDAAVAQLPQQQRAAAKAKLRSSWDAKDARGGGGDYLFELGQADYNTNVDVGATAALGLDSLFHGNAAFGLGAKSDIADGSLRGFEFRKYDNLYGDYYISPQFLEAVTMHIAKNFMWESLGGSRVPVILGIWGPKGCGKTFMTELAFKKLGVEPIIMSAGELEHEWAGTPGRLVRERYRRASELSRVRGRLSCLLINDLDAGLGHFEHTQVTVNNQNVVGTLMNIADDPTRVSGGGSWREAETLRRIPIIVTGNDFSTLYAPLIRQGRMEQFYWKPNRIDLLAILTQMYKEDNVSRDDLEQLLDTFPDQPLDFYGAIRAATYDNQIREWIKEDVAKAEEINEDTDLTELGKRLLNKDRLPAFNTDHVNLEALLAEGRRLRAEQEAVGAQRLAKEYMNDTGFRGQSMIGLGG